MNTTTLSVTNTTIIEIAISLARRGMPEPAR